MDLNYKALAELGPDEKLYKGYYIPLEKGYVRIMASKLDKEGMVVAINYYGKINAEGKTFELNRVTDKRQKPEEFDADLERFQMMLEKSGIKIFIKEL